MEQRKERRERVNLRRRARSSRRPNSEGEDDNINHTQRARPSAMMVDEQEPSPIARARLMPHLAGDGNVSLSAYNDTTLTEENDRMFQLSKWKSKVAASSTTKLIIGTVF